METSVIIGSAMALATIPPISLSLKYCFFAEVSASKSFPDASPASMINASSAGMKGKMACENAMPRFKRLTMLL